MLKHTKMSTPSLSPVKSKLGNWRKVQLKEVAKTNYQNIDSNYPYKIIQYLDTGSITRGKIECFQQYSISEAPSRAKRLVKNGDIVYSDVRPIQRHYGFIKDPPNNLVVSTGFSVIKADQSKANPLFIYYLLTSNNIVEGLDAIAEGATSAYPSIRPSDIENLEIILPSLPEQKAIAEVLSSLDDKIELLNRQNKTLEDIAKALFRKWFVEKTDHFKSDKFSLWIKDTVGGEWGKEEASNDFNVPVYCIRGTDIASLNLGLPKKIPIRFIKQKKLESIKSNDSAIIIEISGGTDNQSTGRTTYIDKYVKSLFKLPLIFSNFCRMLIVKKKEYTFFVYCYLQYLYYQKEYFNLENGSSGIRNLNYKALLFQLDYPMPDKNNVLNFDKQVKDYFIKINKNKSQINTLEKLRNILLPKLMNGNLRVKF